MNHTLSVTEIFYSVQGESTFMGLPCIMIRLAGCDMRCSYCDTTHAHQPGTLLTVEEIIAEVESLAGNKFYCNGRIAGKYHMRLPLVEVTGGEPLLQPATLTLLTMLCDHGYTVLLETNGAHDITSVDPRVHRILDLKCPSSGECDRNRLENIPKLEPRDEIKFVIASKEDYEWAREMLFKYELFRICPVLFSWAEPVASPPKVKLNPFPADHHRITRSDLAELILRDRLPVHFQIQLHKLIWPGIEQGV